MNNTCQVATPWFLSLRVSAQFPFNVFIFKYLFTCHCLLLSVISAIFLSTDYQRFMNHGIWHEDSRMYYPHLVFVFSLIHEHGQYPLTIPNKISFKTIPHLGLLPVHYHPYCIQCTVSIFSPCLNVHTTADICLFLCLLSALSTSVAMVTLVQHSCHTLNNIPSPLNNHTRLLNLRLQSEPHRVMFSWDKFIILLHILLIACVYSLHWNLLPVCITIIQSNVFQWSWVCLLFLVCIIYLLFNDLI